MPLSQLMCTSPVPMAMVMLIATQGRDDLMDTVLIPRLLSLEHITVMCTKATEIRIVFMMKSFSLSTSSLGTEITDIKGDRATHSKGDQTCGYNIWNSVFQTHSLCS